MDQTPSDDRTASPALLRSPDPHGQAAMLLVESLIHGLIARDVITTADAIEFVGVASEVKMEFAEELGDTAATLRQSLVILDAIGTSLKNDVEID